MRGRYDEANYDWLLMEAAASVLRTPRSNNRLSMGGFVYIITNKYNTALYVGSATDLLFRIQQHKNKAYKSSFSARYNISKLVYFECFNSRYEAYQREYQIKSGSRAKKIALIIKANPDFDDLYDDIVLNGIEKSIYNK